MSHSKLEIRAAILGGVGAVALALVLAIAAYFDGQARKHADVSAQDYSGSEAAKLRVDAGTV